MAENNQPSKPDLNGPQIKVCGLTRVAEALTCLDAGVDAIGLVFYPPSPRFVRPKRAGQISAAVGGRAVTVGVFVDETYDTIIRSATDCALQAVQLHGQESPGGNAAAWPWQDARNIDRRKPVILAGGLTPENVSTAIRRGSPDAVDVSSGVESTPGRKQSTKIKSFINAVVASDNRATRRIF